MTPEKYLHDLGMDESNTVLISYIGGTMRNPSIVQLLEGYKNYKEEQENICPDCGEPTLRGTYCPLC